MLCDRERSQATRATPRDKESGQHATEIQAATGQVPVLHRTCPRKGVIHGWRPVTSSHREEWWQWEAARGGGRVSHGTTCYQARTDWRSTKLHSWQTASARRWGTPVRMVGLTSTLLDQTIDYTGRNMANSLSTTTSRQTYCRPTLPSKRNTPQDPWRSPGMRVHHSVWWQVERCEVCAKQLKQRSKPLILVELPDRLWQKIATDLFTMQGDTYSSFQVGCPKSLRMRALLVGPLNWFCACTDSRRDFWTTNLKTAVPADAFPNSQIEVIKVKSTTSSAIIGVSVCKARNSGNTGRLEHSHQKLRSTWTLHGLTWRTSRKGKSFKTKQKRDFDRRHGAHPLTPLLGNTDVWVTSGLPNLEPSHGRVVTPAVVYHMQLGGGEKSPRPDHSSRARSEVLGNTHWK